MIDQNHDIVPTLRMFSGVMMGQAADEIERLRSTLAAEVESNKNHVASLSDEIFRLNRLWPAQAGQTAEPVAWAVWWGIGTMRQNSVHFERKTAEEAAAQIKSCTELRPLYEAIAQPEQQTERNFCTRCGKRLAGDGVHTCTPPKAKK